jgi:hypothetical protein
MAILLSSIVILVFLWWTIYYIFEE